MKTVQVSSLPIKDVITDIAREWDVPYTENCSIYEVLLPEKIGKGKVNGIDFNEGLGLIQYDCVFFEDTEIKFSVDKVHPLKFLFCQEGCIAHQFMNESIWHNIPQLKNAIVASSEHNGHVIQFKKNERTLLNSLELDRRKFQSKVSCELKSLGKPWNGLLNDILAKNTFYHDGFYSLELAGHFKEWSEFDNDNFIKRLYLEGLAYKILTLQIVQFQDDLRKEGNKTLLRQSELKQLLRAIDIITNQIDDLPTIESIAVQVGLNEKKLQQGFRELLGKSVNSYIREQRLLMARHLLKNTDYTLSSISSMIGYKSKSYFSKIFKVEYGLLPSEYRNKIAMRKIDLKNKL
ncbi:Regulatory protein PchR [Flagellimonas maritima]|uniref:Regulatory protein PchR n=1 Tax=Flagellimonas maritima TaxID=1383885 RepID=A0A2Z4LNZ0_9FLAO|nr:AraC family transcriptional regulator [Allomuricauda aurantiaca]AWX43254.1 Regulatory protein PchR [Allomuricauda aurantiaca]